MEIYGYCQNVCLLIGISLWFRILPLLLLHKALRNGLMGVDDLCDKFLATMRMMSKHFSEEHRDKKPYHHKEVGERKNFLVLASFHVLFQRIC